MNHGSTETRRVLFAGNRFPHQSVTRTLAVCLCAERLGHLVVPSSRLQPAGAQRRRSGGFTIIELLAVMTLIALLIGILFGAAQFIVKTSRQRRAETTALALKNAITTYRHSYGKWPIPDSTAPGLQTALANLSSGIPATNNFSQWTIGKSDDGIFIIVSNAANYLVFDMLRANTNNMTPFPAENAQNFHFIDDSTVFAENPTGSGQRTPRYRLPASGNMIEAGHPIVYMTRDGATAYYGITLWLELEKADVGM